MPTLSVCDAAVMCAVCSRCLCRNAATAHQVDTDRFPDMKAMTAKAKSLGIKPGWYGNNCHCADRTCCEEKCFKGDVQATIDYGFESIKLDGCGCVGNITLYVTRLG